MSEIVHIPFHGGEVMAVMNGNKPNIVLKPAIEHIGVDYWTQVEKLRSRSWATTSQSPVVAEDGKVRDMVTVDLRTFLRILRAAGILRQAGCIPHKSERRFFYFTGTAWEIRAWALPHLMRVFRETVREFQRYPFEQLRLDLTSTDRLAIGSDA